MLDGTYQADSVLCALPAGPSGLNTLCSTWAKFCNEEFTLEAAAKDIAAGKVKVFTAGESGTVSQYLSLPVARKPKPPDVMTVVVAKTLPKSVTPSLSKMLPTIVPLVLQFTCKRYQ